MIEEKKIYHTISVLKIAGFLKIQNIVLYKSKNFNIKRETIFVQTQCFKI